MRLLCLRGRTRGGIPFYFFSSLGTAPASDCVAKMRGKLERGASSNARAPPPSAPRAAPQAAASVAGAHDDCGTVHWGPGGLIIAWAMNSLAKNNNLLNIQHSNDRGECWGSSPRAGDYGDRGCITSWPRGCGRRAADRNAMNLHCAPVSARSPRVDVALARANACVGLRVRALWPARPLIIRQYTEPGAAVRNIEQDKFYKYESALRARPPIIDEIWPIAQDSAGRLGP